MEARTLGEWLKSVNETMDRARRMIEKYEDGPLTIGREDREWASDIYRAICGLESDLAKTRRLLAWVTDCEVPN